ncbi:MAG: 5'-methylthioadenosine/S-adenosylhomocysteine nucleosidase [Eubacteriales bacterium SKADARSKE-1]|nr:5'-methylthioadenosine/S-adenosylhomocysteine nucleosidase [Eubacteriales bacterium SKADARSKE-1]
MIGIICAMPIEIEELKKHMVDIKKETISNIEYLICKINSINCVIAIGGIGKVNSAICAQTMILKFSPEIIVSTGIAGGLHSKMNIGDIAIAESTVQHDIDTTAIGDPVGLISTLNIIQIPCTQKLINKILKMSSNFKNTQFFVGTIASGDQFIASKNKLLKIKNEFQAIACDMESGSIAQVCYINKTDFCCIRVISDNINSESSPLDYEKFKKTVAKKMCQIFIEIIACF